MIASMPTAFVLRVLSVLLTEFSLGSSVLLACSCADVKLFCNVLPSSPDGRGQAVFIGRVIEVFPRAKETLQSVLAHVPELVPSEQRTLSLDQQKQLRLQLAQGLLTAAEQQRITEAKDEAELWNIEFRWWRVRRVRLEVLEPFWGVKVGSVELSTAMNAAACGVPFAVGKAYLVDATGNATTGQWHASLCSRSREVVAAQDEIEVLRAWQRGHTLPRRVYGWLAGKDSSRPQPLAADRRLILRGDASQYETRSDERGYFRFADVAPGQYRLETDAPGYQVKWIQLSRSANEKSPIDLDTNRCAELFVSFDQRAP
jgi:hypothetical protein